MRISAALFKSSAMMSSAKPKVTPSMLRSICSMTATAQHGSSLTTPAQLSLRTTPTMPMA